MESGEMERELRRMMARQDVQTIVIGHLLPLAARDETTLARLQAVLETTADNVAGYPLTYRQAVVEEIEKFQSCLRPDAGSLPSMV